MYPLKSFLKEDPENKETEKTEVLEEMGRDGTHCTSGIVRLQRKMDITVIFPPPLKKKV